MLSIIPRAMAQNYNTSAPSTSTTQQSNSSITLGNPIFTEYDKATPPKPAVVNGTHGLKVSYLSSGIVKGVNFRVNGSIFIVSRSDRFADLRGMKLTTANGEKGTYNFYSKDMKMLMDQQRTMVLYFFIPLQMAN